MNNVVLIGRLVRDPELRYTANGKAVAQFSIAVNRPFSKTKEADFFNIVVWGKTGENCSNYLAKGRLVGVQGRLQSRSYENKAGVKKYITEVVADRVEFLEWGKKEEFKSKSNEVDSELDNFKEIDANDDVPF